MPDQSPNLELLVLPYCKCRLLCHVIDSHARVCESVQKRGPMSVLDKVRKEFDSWVADAETTGMLDFQSMSKSEGICMCLCFKFMIVLILSDSRLLWRDDYHYCSRRLS